MLRYNTFFLAVQCGKKEVWRSVASCEPTCGVDPSEECDEDPEEGCVCISGYKRQGQDCVPVAKCGCEIDMPDGSVWNMPVSKLNLRLLNFVRYFCLRNILIIHMKEL